MDFDVVTADEQQVIHDPEVDVVFSITRHNLHARQVVDSLKAGKHVFVEKPLAMNMGELAEIETTLSGLKEKAPLVMVGFNRRFSPFATPVRDFFANVKSPLTVSIRFNAGAIPADTGPKTDLIGGGRNHRRSLPRNRSRHLSDRFPRRTRLRRIDRRPQCPHDHRRPCFITLRHANGSVSNIAYLAGGDKSYPKERVEVLGGERLAVIDDFRETLMTYRGKPKKSVVFRIRDTVPKSQPSLMPLRTAKITHLLGRPPQHTLAPLCCPKPPGRNSPRSPPRRLVSPDFFRTQGRLSYF